MKLHLHVYMYINLNGTLLGASPNVFILFFCVCKFLKILMVSDKAFKVHKTVLLTDFFSHYLPKLYFGFNIENIMKRKLPIYIEIGKKIELLKLHTSKLTINMK